MRSDAQVVYIKLEWSPEVCKFNLKGRRTTQDLWEPKSNGDNMDLQIALKT